MKKNKFFPVFLLFLCLLLSLLSCQSKAAKAGKVILEDAKWEQQKQYVDREGYAPFLGCEYEVCQTVGDLADKANVILKGKVVDISFEIHNSDGEVIENCQEEQRENFPAESVFYTVYTVEVHKIYKRAVGKTVRFAMMGGQRDFHEEEQLELMDQSGYSEKYGRKIRYNEAPKLLIEENQEYLFCFTQTAKDSADRVHVINPAQFAFEPESNNARAILHYLTLTLPTKQ